MAKSDQLFCSHAMTQHKDTPLLFIWTTVSLTAELHSSTMCVCVCVCVCTRVRECVCVRVFRSPAQFQFREPAYVATYPRLAHCYVMSIIIVRFLLNLIRVHFQ